MLLRERHRRVEADDREAPGDRQDGLDDRFADVGTQVVELRGVVPRHAGPVIAVVDVADLAGLAVLALEDHRRVGGVPVVVLDVDADVRIVGQVRAVEAVRGVGRIRPGQEPVRVLHDPARVDPHVIRDHVRGEADAAGPGPLAQVRVGGLAAEILGDRVVAQRIGRRHGVGVPAELLDALGRAAALPEPDQPEPAEPPARQPVELLVGDLVEPADRSAVRLRELVQPDVGALGHEDGARHPRLVLGEALEFHVQVSEVRWLGGGAPAGAAMKAHPEGALVLGRDVNSHDQSIEQRPEPVPERRGEEGAPVGADPAKLAAQAFRLGHGRCTQHRDEVLALRPERRPRGEEAADLLDDGPVARGGRQVRVVEQLAEGVGRRVRVGEPAVGELLEGDLAVRGAVRLAGEVLRRRQLATVDGERRETGREPGQRRVDGLRAQDLVEVIERVVDRLGVLLLAIDADHGMQDLVHEAERVELTRADRRVGYAVVAPSRRHLGGEAPHRAQVRQDDVPGQREERLVQAIAGAGLRRDVELAPAHGVTGMPYRRISLIAACVVGLPAAGVFFAGYQSRIVILRWVTPTIPSSGGMSTRCDP